MTADDLSGSPPAPKILDMPDDPDAVEPLLAAMDQRRIAGHRPDRIDCDPRSVEKGLAKLVLSVVELLRQLLERQAIRRVDQGDLDDRQVEDIGLALMRLETRMAELKAAFSLTDSDLHLDLGPVEDLLREPRQETGSGKRGRKKGSDPFS